LPRTNDAETTARKMAIESALLRAAQVPLDTAHLCVRVMGLAEIVAHSGNPNAITDAGTAAALAEAACIAASYNVRVNVKSLSRASGVPDLVESVQRAVEDIKEASARVTTLVEKALT
jgi:formiminotetrahydrofolate cyclodeaminase